MKARDAIEIVARPARSWRCGEFMVGSPLWESKLTVGQASPAVESARRQRDANAPWNNECLIST